MLRLLEVMLLDLGDFMSRELKILSEKKGSLHNCIHLKSCLYFAMDEYRRFFREVCKEAEETAPEGGAGADGQGTGEEEVK